MSSILNKNAIMTRYVDSFCLACETHLRSDEDALMHIAKPIHKKNLDSTTFLENYKEDHVRKVKKGYYCEFCNFFIKTAAKVGPHVAGSKHFENKVTQPFRREGNGVLAFDKVLIPENSWHGLKDDTCAVCDAEFANAQIHRTEAGHVLNLVLIEIEFWGDSNIYRKVDDSTFQCMTCNQVCALKAMTAHFDDPEHKKLYQQCCESAKTKVNEPKQETSGTLKEDEQGETKRVTKKETVQRLPEKEILKENKPKKAPDAVKPKEEQPKKTPITENKQEVKNTKLSENGLSKDKFSKTDRDFCDILGAEDFLATDLDGKRWCILCDWSMNEDSMQSHINSKHHKTMLKMHKKRQEEKAEKPDEETANLVSNEVDVKAEEKSKILDSADEFQRNDIKLNIVDGSAYCRICSKNIDFDVDFIRNHIEEHKKNPAKPTIIENVKPFPTGAEKTSSTSLFTSPVRKNNVKPKQDKEKESRASSVASNRDTDVEVETFAKQNSLTYNRDNNNAFCRVCVTKVPASIKNMKEHVNGASHKNKVARVVTKPKVIAIVKKPSHDFIESILTIKNKFSKDIVINEKYCVNIYSFLMMTQNPKLRCQACEVPLALYQVDQHKNTSKHERIMNEAPVVSSEESEFIREVRPNIFHCGFCNQLESTWTTMESHLKSTSHREAKTAANWRLQEYLPMIMQHKAREQMELMLFSRMLMGQMFM